MGKVSQSMTISPSVFHTFRYVEEPLYPRMMLWCRGVVYVTLSRKRTNSKQMGHAI